MTTAYASGQLNGPVTVMPVTHSPPLGGFQVWMAYGLTNEQDSQGDLLFSGAASNFPGGQSLPFGGPAQYRTALLDTGSQLYYFDYADTQIWNLPAAGLDGTHTQTISGVAGSEEADISDALGIYMTGLNNASFSAGNINLNTLNLRGQWNVPVLTAQPGSSLPSIIGSPILPHFQFRINNSQPVHMNNGIQTLRSPSVQMLGPNSAYDTSAYYKMAADVLSVNGVSPDPFYFPDVLQNNWANNPLSPGVWAGLFANVTVGEGTRTNGSDKQFLFDTGADVTVISKATAGQLGIAVSGPNPTPPEFHVSVTGAGGEVADVPGYYIDSLTLDTEGDALTFTNVAVLVIDLPDPRDAIGFVPGIIGMNLFTDRNLIINGNTADPYIAFSEQWEWKNPAGGNWSVAGNWKLALPNMTDGQANFLGAITQPQTINVDGAGFTVGTMTFDNANRYTIAGSTVTFSSSLNDSRIRTLSGSHLITAPVNLQNDMIVSVLSGATLTISSQVTAPTANITKDGLGLLEMRNIRAAGLDVQSGTVRIIAGGGTDGTSKTEALAIAGGAHLDLTNNKLIVDYTGSGTDTLVELRSSLHDGLLTSSAALAGQGLGYADNATLGLASFGGLTVDATSALVKLTWLGDANLDGQVDITDLAALATSWQGSGSFWFAGDFNYDGTVDITDLAALATNWQAGVGAPLGMSFDQALATLGLGGVAVPEPGMLAIVALPILLRRRRRS